MSKSVYELLFDLLILAALVFFVAKAFSLTGGAGRVPLFVGIPTLVLMAVKTAVSLSKHFSAPARDGQFIGKEESDGAQSKILNEILWLCIFTVLIIFLGVILGSVTFLLMYLRLHNKDSWRLSTVVCVAVVIASYFIFQEALKMQLYEGVLPGIISERLNY